MTAIQICALIVLILLVGLTYGAGYRGGLIDRRLESIDDGSLKGSTPTSDLIQKIQAQRVSITWEYEGGCHVWRYWDSDEPCEKAYGNTIQVAFDILDTQTI